MGTHDPTFATAFAARSFASFQDAMMGYLPDRQEAQAAVRSVAERIIELDPLRAETFVPQAPDSLTVRART
jgi:hypothetical protein